MSFGALDGAAWNKHDTSCLNDALRLAVGHELPSLHAEYGGLRLRFDFVLHGQAKLSTFCHGADSHGDGHSDVEMQHGQPATAGQPAIDGAAAQSRHGKKAPWQKVEAPAAAAEAAAEAMDDDAPDEIGRLRRKEVVRREAKKRQRQNRRAREAQKKEAAAKAATSPVHGFTFGGGPPPGLNPTASPFVFGVSGSASPSTSGVACTAGEVGGSPSKAHERRIRCPALVLGPGDLPLVQAQAMLLEKITAANCARARASDDPDACRRIVRAIPRSCIFPDSTVGRRQVMLLEGSRGARMSETELGAALATHLNPQLDDVRLRQLIAQLWKRADEE